MNEINKNFFFLIKIIFYTLDILHPGYWILIYIYRSWSRFNAIFLYEKSSAILPPPLVFLDDVIMALFSTT